MVQLEKSISKPETYMKIGKRKMVRVTQQQRATTEHEMLLHCNKVDRNWKSDPYPYNFITNNI